MKTKGFVDSGDGCIRREDYKRKNKAIIDYTSSSKSLLYKYGLESVSRKGLAHIRTIAEFQNIRSDIEVLWHCRKYEIRDHTSQDDVILDALSEIECVFLKHENILEHNILEHNLQHIPIAPKPQL